MPGKDHVKVMVTFVDGEPECEPDWVQLCWETGPDTIKWVFKNVPKSVTRVDVDFLDHVPKKYKEKPGFLGRGPFRGMGFDEPSAGSKIKDIVTVGNTKEEGYFCYELYFYDRDGNLVARTDPGGDNNPVPPN